MASTPDLIDCGHAASLVVDGIEGLLRCPSVVVDHLPAVGHGRVGPHKHDGAICFHLFTDLMVCDALLHIEKKDTTCRPNTMSPLDQGFERQ